jgi:protease I
MLNAGALWQDKEVIVDDGIITSRSPEDLPVFCEKLIEEIAQNSHVHHIPPSEEYSQRFLQ